MASLRRNLARLGIALAVAAPFVGGHILVIPGSVVLSPGLILLLAGGAIGFCTCREPRGLIAAGIAVVLLDFTVLTAPAPGRLRPLPELYVPVPATISMERDGGSFLHTIPFPPEIQAMLRRDAGTACGTDGACIAVRMSDHPLGGGYAIAVGMVGFDLLGFGYKLDVLEGTWRRVLGNGCAFTIGVFVNKVQEYEIQVRYWILPREEGEPRDEVRIGVEWMGPFRRQEDDQ